MTPVILSIMVSQQAASTKTRNNSSSINHNKLKQKRHLETAKKAQSSRLQRNNQALFQLLLLCSNDPATMKVLICHDYCYWMIWEIHNILLRMLLHVLFFGKNTKITDKSLNASSIWQHAMQIKYMKNLTRYHLFLNDGSSNKRANACYGNSPCSLCFFPSFLLRKWALLTNTRKAQESRWSYGWKAHGRQFYLPFVSQHVCRLLSGYPAGVRQGKFNPSCLGDYLYCYIAGVTARPFIL